MSKGDVANCEECGKEFIQSKKGHRFCHVHCTHKNHFRRRTVANPGYRIISKTGYAFCFAPDHPNANPLGLMREHVLVKEKELGRYLLPREEVHHRNCIRHDNRSENLVLKWTAHGSGTDVEDLVEYFMPMILSYLRVHGYKIQFPVVLYSEKNIQQKDFI